MSKAVLQGDYNKLKEELEYLVSVKRQEVSANLKEAREFGDLSENAEYDAAKNEQAEVEEKIRELEDQLRNAEIITNTDVSDGIVKVGCVVTLKEKDKKGTKEYIIGGSTKVDPFKGKISNESPIGKTLLGRKIGDVVDIEVPAGILVCEILDVKAYEGESR